MPLSSTGDTKESSCAFTATVKKKLRINKTGVVLAILLIRKGCRVQSFHFQKFRVVD
jgi:hypothetical protein